MVEDAMTTHVRRMHDDNSHRLVEMERHLAVMDGNRATLEAEIEKTRRALKQSEDMLKNMTKPADPQPVDPKPPADPAPAAGDKTKT